MSSNSYRYSFSGADARAYVYYTGHEQKIQEQELEALHTISFSTHEAKGHARALGFRGVKGFGRGVRTIAGSMIFSIIEDHPLRPLIRAAPKIRDQHGWSVDAVNTGIGTALNHFDFSNRLATLLPSFNLLMRYTSEGALFPGLEVVYNRKAGKLVQQERTVDNQAIPGAALLLRNIEIIDDGMVTSVNDIVTEMSFSFVACDMKPFSFNTFSEFIHMSQDLSRDQAKASQLADVLGISPSVSNAAQAADQQAFNEVIENSQSAVANPDHSQDRWLARQLDRKWRSK